MKPNAPTVLHHQSITTMKSTVSFLLTVCASLALPQIGSAQHFYCEQGPVIRLCPPAHVQLPHCDFTVEHNPYCEPARVQYREVETVREVSTCITPSVPRVISVQRVLARCGYFTRGQYPKTGVCDAPTIDAIRGFQRSKGLPVTGEVDDALLSAMEIQAPAQDNAAAGKAPATNPAPAGEPAETKADTTASPDGTTAEQPNSNEAPQASSEADTTKPEAAPEKTDLSESKQIAEDILIADEVAKLLRVDEKDVVDLFEKGELPGKKVGDSWRTTRSSVVGYLNGK